MKILALTRYSRRGASSRLRTYQYVPHLETSGIHVDVSPLFGDSHLETIYSGRGARPADIGTAYLKRTSSLVEARKYDLVWIEKEVFPFLPAFAERILGWSGIPYIVDFDDAVFHRYDRHPNALTRRALSGKIAAVMSSAACVVAGNEYLAEYARRAGARRVEIIPTVIDLDRYPLVPSAENEVFTVGWIGTPVTAKYLSALVDPLRRLSETGRLRLVVVGAEIEMDGVEIDCRPWSVGTEFDEISHFDAGIMPLPDTPWERGKCGYKLIQYLAAGKPVVASPVGANRSIVEEGISGYLAGSLGEWSISLAALRDNAGLRSRMGGEGRKQVERAYCLQVTAPRLAGLIQDVATGDGRFSVAVDP